MNLAIKKLRQSIEELRDKYVENFAYLDSKFVNRTTELEVIKTAILCSAHVMLEGPPGVAKSLLARSIFSMVDDDPGACVFFKQLTPSTHPEEIFGPMNIRKFRENSVYEFNMEGLLPCAHFAYLDEVYRGSEALLSSVMGVLNEREFYNGTNHIKCPLISAIGTCNFRVETAEMEAFHDRWLFNVKVKPAETIGDKIAILMAHLDNDLSNLELPHDLKLSDIKRLQTAAKAQTMPDFFVQTFADICRSYETSPMLSDAAYISDRRFCQAYQAAQAAAFVSELEGDECMTVFEVLGSVIPSQGSSANTHREAFIAAYSTEVTARVTAGKEEPEIQEIERLSRRLLGKYDPSMTKREMATYRDKLRLCLEDFSRLSPAEQFVISGNVSRMQKVVTDLSSRLNDVEVELALQP